MTAPARTILDLARGASAARLEQLVAEARVKGVLRAGELEAALAAAGRRPGAGRLRALLDSEREPAFTRRDLELRMLELVRAAGLPQPLVNSQLLGFEVDFLWPEARLVVETDGGRFHGHRRAFERDRRRDQFLLAAGYRVMRVTWRQLTRDPLGVVARLAMALAQRAA